MSRHAGPSNRMFGRRSIVKAGAAGAAGSLLLPRISFAQDATPSGSSAASPAANADGFYPSTGPGIYDAYSKMPATFKATDGAPGNGEKVSALVMIYGAPATSKDGNAYWQGLNQRMNIDWSPIQVPNSSYGEKASAIFAGGDLPDLIYLNFNQTSTPLQKFVKDGAFVDLTDYVTGDNLQKYPNLAKFPDYMWQACATDGRIYGVPCPSGRSGQVPAHRLDWVNKLLGHEPTNAQEMHDLMVGMAKNDPDGNGSDDTWAIARYSSDWDMSILYPMHRVPNEWRVNDDGSFTRSIETDEYKATLEFITQAVKDGAYHPDSVSMQFEESLNLFNSGRTGIHADGGAIYGKNGFLETIRKYAPDAEVTRLIPFGADGGKGVTYNLPGIFGFTAIGSQHEGNDDKIDLMLRIFNWLSSPFGSEEWLYKTYGEEGTHFTYNENGFPVRTELMDKEEGSLTAYIGGSLQVFWNPDDPTIPPLQQQEQIKVLEIGIDNPAQNLYSPTQISESPVLSQIINDAVTSIVTGREDISSLDKVREDWKSRGGDKIREELQEAYKANQG
ncbi:MAG: extracellular solute-binding protein [Thermomicrobiales bacterium]